MVVKVKKEIVDLINKALSTNYYKDNKLKLYKDYCKVDCITLKNKLGNYLSLDFSPLKEMSKEEVLAIILGEYEIEETVEERLLNYYNQAKLNLDHFDPDVVTFYKGYISAFDIVLGNLNVKIEGINK